MHFESPGYTGRLLENEIFGETEKGFQFFEKGNGYLNYEKSQRMAKNMQKFDPTDPDPRFANDLHATVAEKLDLEDYGRLSFFCSVGTPLDYLHGVDAFFEYLPEGAKKPIIITLDATCNPNKEECKADILVKLPPEGLDPIEDKEEYLEKIDELAKRIVEVIKYRSKGEN